jgi:hypothetical protein
MISAKIRSLILRGSQGNGANEVGFAGQRSKLLEIGKTPI